MCVRIAARYIYRPRRESRSCDYESSCDAHAHTYACLPDGKQQENAHEHIVDELDGHIIVNVFVVFVVFVLIVCELSGKNTTDQN
jgi:hypothetical protein